MPSCRVTNYTSQPLNVALKHLCALHFENEVAPGQTVKLKPGRVWFTLEVLVDNKENQYSAAQSAAAIAIISLACVGAATAAVPAIAAAGGATAIGGTIGSGIGTIGTTIGSIGTTIGSLGTTIVTSGATVVAAGETMLAGVGTAFVATSGFIHAHAAAAGVIAAPLLPRAIEIVEKEVGGFNNVQKEVVSILSAPNVTQDIRTQGLSLLGRLGVAVAADRVADRAAAADAEREEDKRDKASSSKPLPLPLPAIEDGGDASGPTSRPTLKRMQTSVSTLLNKVSTEIKEGKENRLERKATRKESKAAKQVASWEMVDFDITSEPTMLSSKEKLRIHGLFMNERRHFEVREKEGKLVLMDANTREIVVG